MGLFRRDGGPIDAEQLLAMTAFLAYRGPDAKDTLTGYCVGFGHTLLLTTEISSTGGQPARLDQFWITADARLDSREELIRKLEAAGRRVELHTADAMLILHGYAAWGPSCVERLRGDFSFAIWDTQSKTLFCARDHFGIKPFYYADLGDLFLFSNTLNCLRTHPKVTATLNELAIGDFLLFGLNYDKSTTTFRDIQRLAPAHSLEVAEAGLRARCYWRPPTEGRIRYTHENDYIDHFNELLKQAVDDRLRSENVGIFLSGGLDSGTVAVSAKEIAQSRGGIPNLRSYTVGYDFLIPDDEILYARKVADYLGIPNQYLALDYVQLFEKWGDGKYRFPEPIDDPLAAGEFEQFEMVAPDCRVMLSGEGADNLMYFQMWPYAKDLQRAGEWGRLLKETAWFLSVRPFPWRGATQRLQSLFTRATGGAGIPVWIAPAFAKRAGLEERWKECSSAFFPEKRHPSRPKGHASMLLPQWTSIFEWADPGVTHSLSEIRYPFLDLRLVDYLLGVPAFPWVYKKGLLRKALIGRIPESILRRPKKPLSGYPVVDKFRSGKPQAMKPERLDGKILDYVAPSGLTLFYGRIEFEQFRPYCLDLWLRYGGDSVLSGDVNV